MDEPIVLEYGAPKPLRRSRLEVPALAIAIVLLFTAVCALRRGINIEFYAAYMIFALPVALVDLAITVVLWWRKRVAMDRVKIAMAMLCVWLVYSVGIFFFM